MKTVILCGGKGTRIRDVAEELPKPMIPIGRDPILKHIMDIYGAHGHHEFVLCLGHLGWRIRHYFINFRAEQTDVEVDFANDSMRYLESAKLPPWRITLADTGVEAMTGCRVKRIEKHVGNDTFMLTYGDGVADIEIDQLLEFHRSHGKLMTITSVKPPSRFGELETDGDLVRAFHEKPQAGNGRINGGFFVCEPGVFDFLADDESCVLEQEPLQRLAADGQLMSFRHDGFWMPMDTPREYARLNELWRCGEAPWSVDSQRLPDVILPRPEVSAAEIPPVESPR